MNPVHLRSAGTSLLISFDSGEAEIIHWGADLGEHLPDLAILGGPVPHSAVDAPSPPGCSRRPPPAGAAGPACAATGSPTASPATTSRSGSASRR